MSKKENVSKNGAAPKYYLPMWQLVLLFCATLGFYWFYLDAFLEWLLLDTLQRKCRNYGIFYLLLALKAHRNILYKDTSQVQKNPSIVLA